MRIKGRPVNKEKKMKEREILARFHESAAFVNDRYDVSVSF